MCNEETRRIKEGLKNGPKALVTYLIPIRVDVPATVGYMPMGYSLRVLI